MHVVRNGRDWPDTRRGRVRGVFRCGPRIGLGQRCPHRLATVSRGPRGPAASNARGLAAERGTHLGDPKSGLSAAMRGAAFFARGLSCDDALSELAYGMRRRDTRIAGSESTRVPGAVGHARRGCRMLRDPPMRRRDDLLLQRVSETHRARPAVRAERRREVYGSAAVRMDGCGGGANADCPADLVCGNFYCVAGRQLGEPCKESPCARGLFCGYPSWLCEMTAKAGEPCRQIDAPILKCREDLLCVDGTCLTRDNRLVAPGESCGRAGPNCAAGTCENGRCPSLSTEGETCDLSHVCASPFGCDGVCKLWPPRPVPAHCR
jgi:hypothetical protein